MKYIFLLCYLNIFILTSQNQSITSIFDFTGYLNKEPLVYSSTLCKFKKGKEFMVINYIGDSWWKVANNKCEGYIESHFIIVNEQMKQLVEKYNITEQRRKEAIKQDSIKKAKINQLIKEEKQRQKDSLFKIKTDNANKKRKERKLIEQEEKIKYRNTCHYDFNEIDQFDNIRKIKTEQVEISPGIYVALYRSGSLKYITFRTVNDLGCVSSYSNSKSYVKVKLQNNQIITFYHFNDIDCSGFKLYGKISSAEISKLKASPIKSIRLSG